MADESTMRVRISGSAPGSGDRVDLAIRVGAITSGPDGRLWIDGTATGGGFYSIEISGVDGEGKTFAETIGVEAPDG